MELQVQKYLEPATDQPADKRRPRSGEEFLANLDSAQSRIESVNQMLRGGRIRKIQRHDNAWVVTRCAHFPTCLVTNP
jgi:hypothetical protein